jgi:lipopolysaccharide/colanic/teichoic acid biosynthesis glycosyltransferase
MSQHQSFYLKVGKRVGDLLLSLCLGVLLLPVLLVIALLVRLFLGKGIFFKQERPGLHDQVFTLIKFRTMTDQRDAAGNFLPDTVRLTKFGKFLRATSLDELPELWNIFRGEMSFVGPRPLLVDYLPRYSKKQRGRHRVRPGLTGLAQVSGRNAISWEQKFEHDLAYIQTMSFKEDCRIFLLTIKKVVASENIAVDVAGDSEFKGDVSNDG